MSSTRIVLRRLGVVTAPSTRRTISTTRIAARQGPAGGDKIPVNDPQTRHAAPNVSKTDEVPVSSMGARDAPLQELVPEGEKKREMQAPNRADVWSRNQMPREEAMVGPRFEQTMMEYQPRPYAAIDLIHQQPVRWVNTKTVACDGGGGPLGHPRIFINVDKPQICWCTYCGLPYAHTHHRKILEAIPKDKLSYPLEPSNDPRQVRMPSSPSQHGEIQGQYAHLKGEQKAESQDGQPFSQR